MVKNNFRRRLLLRGAVGGSMVIAIVPAIIGIHPLISLVAGTAFAGAVFRLLTKR